MLLQSDFKLHWVILYSVKEYINASSKELYFISHKVMIFIYSLFDFWVLRKMEQSLVLLNTFS